MLLELFKKLVSYYNKIKKFVKFTLYFIFKPRLIVIIGNYGTSLIALKNNRILDHQFIDKAHDDNINGFQALIKKYNKTKIHIFIDDENTKLKTVSIPVFNNIVASRVIERFTSKEYNADDIIAYNIIDITKSPIETWRVNISSTKYDNLIKNWIKYIILSNNEIGDLHFVNLESQTLINLITKQQFISSQDNSIKLYVFNSASLGLRQFAIHNSDLLVDSHTELPKDKSINYLSGFIDNEINETILYLNKVKNIDLDIDLYLSVEEEIAEKLSTKNYHANNFQLISIAEIYNHLKIKRTKNDFSQKFLDIIVAVILSQDKKYKATNSKIKKFSELVSFNKIAFKFAFLTLISLFVISGLNKFKETKIEHRIKLAEQKLLELNSEYAQLKSEYKHIKNIEAVSQIFLYRDHLKTYNKKPFDLLRKFLKIEANNIKINSINWKAEDYYYGNKNKKNIAIAKIDIDYRHNSSLAENINLKDLFEKYIQTLRENFKGYEVEYSRLTYDTNERDNDDQYKLSTRIIIIDK